MKNKNISLCTVFFMLCFFSGLNAQDFTYNLKKSDSCLMIKIFVDFKIIKHDTEIDSMNTYFKNNKIWRTWGDNSCEKAIIDERIYYVLYNYASRSINERIVYQDICWGIKKNQSFMHYAMPFKIQDFAVDDLNSLLKCTERSFLSGSFVGYYVPYGEKLDSAKMVWQNAFANKMLYGYSQRADNFIKLPFRHETLHIIDVYFNLSLFERICFIDMLVEKLSFDNRLLGLFFLDLNTIFGTQEVFLNENGFLDKILINSAIQKWKIRFRSG